jgi:hypothetical protein
MKNRSPKKKPRGRDIIDPECRRPTVLFGHWCDGVEPSASGAIRDDVHLVLGEVRAALLPSRCDPARPRHQSSRRMRYDGRSLRATCVHGLWPASGDTAHGSWSDIKIGITPLPREKIAVGFALACADVG